MRASVEAIRRSDASAMHAPAPAVVPFREAMTGLRRWRMLRTSSHVRRVNSSSPSASRVCNSPMMSRTSPPEQKARPAPVMTTARTSFSCCKAANASVSSR
jgi:hypothetical protein